MTLTIAIPLIIKRIAIFLYYISSREDGRDCGGVSTPGHGQGEGPDGDKWAKTTQETLGGAGVSEANGVLRNHYHPPGATIYIEKRLTNQSYRLFSQPLFISAFEYWSLIFR